MKKAVLLLMFASLPAVACARHKTGATALQPTTQTVSPATARPGPDISGTDAMTQTVDVDDSRSESEGMASASSTKKASASKKAPAKKKGRK